MQILCLIKQIPENERHNNHIERRKIHIEQKPLFVFQQFISTIKRQISAADIFVNPFE